MCIPLVLDYPGLVTPPGTPSKRNPSLPVPTDNQLSYPIRRYISETLICHVLGQPSYSLTCLLVCAVSQYIDTSVQLDAPITIEEICKKVSPILTQLYACSPPYSSKLKFTCVSNVIETCILQINSAFEFESINGRA